MENKIPNYDRYKTIIEWWIEGGLRKIDGDIKQSLYRLINKYGKTYDNLYAIFPKNMLNTEIAKLDLISTSPIKLKSNQRIVSIKNARGISIEEFGFTRGNIYNKEIITFGEFNVISENTIEFISKYKQKNYSDLIDRVNKLNTGLDEYSNKINRISKNIIANIDKLKEKL